MGLVSTFRLLNRENELHIYGPKGIKEIITLQLKLANSWTNFPLIFHELTSREPELLFEDSKLSVSTLPLKHRIYTNGFLFKEKKGDRKLLIDKAEEFRIDYTLFNSLKKGKDVISEESVTDIFCQSFSVSKSKELVHSSNISILGSLYNALAIAIRCR